MEARSSNNVADDLLTSAQESAARDGLRLAVPAYLEAVDALAAQGRTDEARAVLAQLLAAKEKRRGFLFVKREQSALGDQRQAVAGKYAQLSLGTAPTEESLDILNQLALEFSDDVDVRLANAQALSGAGYLLDALDEYGFCSSQRPDDVAIKVAIASLYCKLGRVLDAAGVYATLPADALKANRSGFDAVIATAAEARLDDAAQRADLVSRLRAASDTLIALDPADRSAAERIDAIAGPPAPAAPEQAPAAPEPEPDPVAAQTVAPAVQSPVTPQPAQAQAVMPEAGSTAAESAPVRRAATGGLSAFAKRKAMELFANSEYEAAVVQLERVVKIAPDVESLEMLLECYLALERHSEAAQTGVQLAEAELAAGNRPGAIATLTTLSKKIADPTVEQRRVELMKTN